MVLGTRQKRQRYFKQILNEQMLSPTDLREAQDLLKTYALLLAKVARAASDEERNETYQRVLAADRQLTALFERARLATARNPRAGVEDPGSSGDTA